jgi:hypothetical protein
MAAHRVQVVRRSTGSLPLIVDQKYASRKPK